MTQEFFQAEQVHCVKRPGATIEEMIFDTEGRAHTCRLEWKHWVFKVGNGVNVSMFWTFNQASKNFFYCIELPCGFLRIPPIPGMGKVK